MDAKLPFKEELKKGLKSVSSRGSVKDVDAFVYTDKVSSVSGDVQVVFVSGKKGTLYDLNLEVKFKVKVSSIDKEARSISGRLKFPEITNGIKQHNFDYSKLNDPPNTVPPYMLLQQYTL